MQSVLVIRDGIVSNVKFVSIVIIVSVVCKKNTTNNNNNNNKRKREKKGIKKTGSLSMIQSFH